MRLVGVLIALILALGTGYVAMIVFSGNIKPTPGQMRALWEDRCITAPENRDVPDKATYCAAKWRLEQNG